MKETELLGYVCQNPRQVPNHKETWTSLPPSRLMGSLGASKGH